MAKKKKSLAERILDFFTGKSAQKAVNNRAKTQINNGKSSKSKSYKSVGKVATQTKSANKTAAKAKPKTQSTINKIASYTPSSNSTYYNKQYSGASRRSVPHQSKKTKSEKSSFEQFSDKQLNSIKKGNANLSIPKVDSHKLTSQYEAYKKRLESDKAKREDENKKQKEEERAKINAINIKRAQKDTVAELKAQKEELQKGKLALKDPKKEIEKINAELKAIKNDRKFKKAYKEEQGKQAKKDLDKQLKSMSLTGTQKSKKKIEKKAEKEKKLDEKYKVSDTEKLGQMADPVRANLSRQFGGKKVYSEKIRKNVKRNVQKSLDKNQFGAGLLQGSMLMGDLYDAVEKQYGIKLDRTKYNKSTSAKIGEAVGMLAMSAVPGATTEAAAAKSLTNVLAKATGKKATSKASKIVSTLAAESTASLPMNIADAAKNSENKKDFAKNLAENVLLDAGLNGVMEGGAALLKNTAKGKAGQALVKMGKGENLTQQEQEAFNKVTARAVAKSATNKKLSKLEEVVLQIAKNRNAKKNLTSTSAADVGPVPTATEAKSSRKDIVSKSTGKGNKKETPYTANANALASTSKNAYTDVSTNNIPESSVKKNVETENRTSRRLTPKDDVEYLSTNKSNETKRKTIKAYDRGEKVVLYGDDETKDFISKAKNGEAGKNTVVYGKTNNRMSNEVSSMNPNVNIKDYYLELVPDNVKHAYDEHHAAKEKGDIPLSDEDFEKIPEYIDTYDDVLNVKTDKNNKTTIQLGKQINGHAVIIEVVSKGRKSVQFKTMWGMESERYAKAYGVNLKKTELTIGGDNNRSLKLNGSSGTPSVTNPSSINNSISKSSVKSNLSEKKIGDTVTEKDFAEPVDLQNDPHVRDILADPDGKVTKETSSFVKKFTEVKDIFRQKTVDSLQGVEKMARKLGGEQGKTLNAQASALRRSGEKATFNLLQKQTDFNNHVVGKGGFEILAPIRKQGKEVYDDFNAYLFHRLNIDRYKNGKTLWGENIVEPEKSQQIIKQFDEKYPDFKIAADETVQFFRNQNTIRVQSGLISKNQKDLLEELYENYVPAYRNIDKIAAAVDSDGIRVDTGIRRAKGGDQAILPIHEQMAYATQRTWKSAELNETIRQIAKAQGVDTKYIAKEIADSADPEDALEEMLNHSVFFEGSAGNTVKAVYFEKGVAKEVQVSKLVFDGIKKWAPSDKQAMLDTGAFDKVLTSFEEAAKAFNSTTPGKGLIKFNDMFKALITSYNPFFLIRNGLKDMQDIPVNSSSLSGFIKNMPKAYRAMMKSIGGEKDPLWETYLAAGVRYSGIMDPKTALKPNSRLSKVNPLKLLENANMAVESYPRFTEFCNILDQLGVKDIKTATREQIERAAKGAADVTCDFGRTGSLTAPVNRSAVPFLNASIQGADKLYRVLSGQKGFRGYVALAGKLAALGAAPAVAQEIIYANDPDYQQLNARDRAGNYFIKNADGTFWKIPRGRTISTITNPAQQAARAFIGNDKMSFDEFKEKLFTDLAPVNPEDSFILKQMFNTYANQTWYGGTIEGWSDQYNDDGTEKLKIERYDPNTSKIGMALSKRQKELFTKAFGEEKAEELTMSPMKWDYLIDSYGGIASDVALSATKIGKTNGWWSETFERNFKKDPVYSNNLSSRYYEKMDEINAAAEKQDATMEERARAKMLGSTSGNLSDLKALQDSIRFDKNMSLKEKSKIDRDLQRQINDLYRNGVSDEAIKAFDNFIAKNKDKYMTEKGLAKAAQQKHEQVTHATVRAMDTLYKYGGIKAVLKNKSHYMDDGEKVAFKFSDDKTIGKIYKNYKENGGDDETFYSLYRKMTKHNKEEGIGTNAKYGNLAAVCIRTGRYNDKKKEQLRKAFGVSEESRQMVNEYFKLGGTMKEYIKAASLAENGANSLKDKQKGGKTTDYNFDAPFKARAIADAKLPDRAYRIIDSADRGRRSEFYINNSRGLSHHNISLKTLQEIDNKIKKGDDGYNTKEGVKSVLERTNYKREEKALIWEALYGLSYMTTNPYGSIGDYSLKSDVGIDTSGGWKNYGSGGYRRYGSGYRRYGSGGSSGSSSSGTEELTEFEKYVNSLMANIQAGDIEAAKMNYSTRKLKQQYGDSYSKAVAKLLAKQVFKS